MKVIFAGTPEFAAEALSALIEAGHEICAVFTQPDRPAGRGRKVLPSAVKKVALSHEIPVFQPLSLKTQEAQDLIASFKAQVMIVAAYGLLLPQAVIDTPEHGCLNIHASILPRWRGAAPIQRAIEAGDKVSGITIMQMDAGLDTGDILMIEEIAIDREDTASSLHDKLAQLGAKLIVRALAKMSTAKLSATAQDAQSVTYAHKMNRAEASIDWQQSAANIVNKIHAFNPWPGTRAKHGETELKILRAQLADNDQLSAAGEIRIHEKKIFVCCKDGWIEVLELQKPGGRAISAGNFLNGYALKSADRLN